MNYLIPNWQQDDAHWGNDRLLHIVRLFTQFQLDHQLILINYIPFLRYKLRDHQLDAENCLRVYDAVQNIQVREGHPLCLEDLALPATVEKIYGPYGVTLYQHNKAYGEVTFNEYGCLEKVTYFGEKTYCDYFDDRGFLSRRVYFNTPQQPYQRDYFNEFGEKTVTEYLGTNTEVRIEAAGSAHFKQQQYPSMQEVLAETLAYLLVDADQRDRVITTTDARVTALTAALSQQLAFIQLIAGEQDLVKVDPPTLPAILTNSHYIVTDTTSQYQRLLRLAQHQKVSTDKIVQIPFYTTQLALGASNSMVQLLIYWRVGSLTETAQTTHRLLMKALLANPKYSLLLHLESYEDEQVVRTMQTEMIEAYFGIDSESVEFQTVSHYLEAKKNKELFTTDEESVKELRHAPQWRDWVAAFAAYQQIDCRVQPTLAQTRTALQQARLFVDLNQPAQLNLQAFAVSAGIPIVARQQTDYFIAHENGLQVQQASEFVAALAYFLDDLTNWNQALVKSINLIKRYGADETIAKWEVLLSDEKN